MKARTATRLLAFAVVALFAISAVSAVGTAAAPAVMTHNSVGSPETVSAPAAPAATSPAASTSPVSQNIAAEMASSALAATKAAGISPHYVFPPRPSATPAQLARSQAQGYVTPLYTGLPAPIGLGYYGLSAAPNGTVAPTILNTTSVQASVDTSGSGIVANDLFQSSPDSFGIQLNAVTTNVTLFGHGGYSFWTQNVVEYYPQADFIVFITNVWNFSGGPLTHNVFYQHGPYGTQVGTTYYYAEAALTGISYPFNLTLTLSSTIADNRNAVFFTIGMTGPSIPSFLSSLTWDYVIFNSTHVNSTAPAPEVSNYTANGFSYNPIGLTDDFELIFGGPGGGSHADLASADASLGLAYWNGSAYVSVPAAYNYGGETGETAIGGTITWSNAPGGPSDLSTYGTMTTGPSILEGLWNATGAEGSYPVTIGASPSNAFSIVTPVGGNPYFQIDEPSVSAGVFGNTLYLMPGSYTITTELSDYAPVTNTIDVTGPTTVPAALTLTLSEGIYTPLWAFSNSQIAAISNPGGAGTVTDPYVLFGGTASLGAVFGLYNDYTFPVYPGIFLMNTTASVELVNEPAMTTATNTFAFPGQYLPSSNSLQEWFWNVSNVAITNSTFTGGWFGAYTYYTAVFDTFNVIFYASTNNLIYRDTFATPSQGLLLFAGSSAFGPSTGGGGQNTVWGSIFDQTPGPTTCPKSPICEGIFPFNLGLGLQVAEGNDTFVNNIFSNPTTAWQLPLNLYSGYPQLYSNLWNVTPGGILPTLVNFPNLPFTGNNILGGAKQGGNYWWDYGRPPVNPYNGAINPYGVLPYDENATTLLQYVYGCVAYYCASYIYPGGDYAPLVSPTATLATVSFYEVGLPASAPWGIVATPTSPLSDLFPYSSATLEASSTVGSPAMLWLPNDTSYSVSSLYAGEQVHGTLSFTALGHTKVIVPFVTTAGYGYLKFKEVGLPSGTLWSVSVEVAPKTFESSSSTTNTIVFILPKGLYAFAVPDTANGYEPKLISGEVRLTTITTVSVRFIPYPFSVTFTEGGLPTGMMWAVQVTGTISGHAKLLVGHSKTSSIEFSLPNGTYNYVVKPIPGFSAGSAASGSFTVDGANVTINLTFTALPWAVTFTETGLPSGTNWSVTLGSTTVYSTTSTIVFELLDGTYSYTIGLELGYSSIAHPDPVHVHGGPASVKVTFRAAPGHGSGPESALGE